MSFNVERKVEDFITNDFMKAAFNAITDEYKENVNNMMAELHDTNNTLIRHDEDITEHLSDTEDRPTNYYHADDYERIAFNSKSEAQTFMQDLNNLGVDVTVSPQKLNGQYIAEISKSVSIDDIEHNSHLYQTVTSQGETSYITSDSIIDDYKTRYGNDSVSDVKKLYYDEDYARREEQRAAHDDNILKDTARDFGSYMLNQLGDLGDFANNVKNVGSEVERYDTSDITKRLLQGDEKIHYFINEESPYAKAQVLHGDTVLINGQLVTDEKLRNSILDQHNERIAATVAITNTTDLQNEIESQRLIGNAKDIRDNANRILASQYNQEYLVDTDAGHQFKSSNSDNEFDKLISDLNTAANISNINTDVDISRLSQETFDIVQNELHLSSELDFVLSDALAKKKNFVTLTIEERRELNDSINRFESTFYTMSTKDEKLFSSLDLNTSSTTDLSSFINSTSAIELNSLLRTLDLYRNHTLSLDEKSVIRKFVKNSRAWAADMAALENINLQLSDPSIDSKTRAELLKKQSELNAKIKKYDISNDDLKTLSLISKNAVVLSKSNQILSDSNQILKMVFEFTAEEQKMLGSNETALAVRALEEDFGLRIDAGNPLTREQLIDVNIKLVTRSQTNGIQLVNINGDFDIKKLEKLNATELRSLGISEETRNLLVKVNKSTSFSTLFKEDLNKIGTFTEKTTRVANTLIQDDDIQQLSNNVHKTVKYTKNSVEFIHGAANQVKLIRSSSRANHINNTLQPNPKSKTVNLKKTSSKEPRVNTRANDRFIQKQRTNLKKMNRRDNGIGANAEKVKNNVVKFAVNTRVGRAYLRANKLKRAMFDRMAQTKAGAAVLNINSGLAAVQQMLKQKLIAFAAKGAVAIGGVILQITCVIIMFICVYMIVMSFANILIGGIADKFNSLAATTFKDTVAYQLYEQMKDNEDSWVDHLGDYQGAWSKRFDLLYGENYESFKIYGQKTIGLYMPDWDSNSSDIYINPFYTKSGRNVIVNDASDIDYKDGVNVSSMTKVTGFDGKNSMGIGTNDNIYSRTEGRTVGGYISNIENGHTSNIKDIIAMTDIMYEMNMDDFYNSVDGLGDTDAGIMGCTPEQLDYANKGFTKWCSWVWNRFTGATDYTWAEVKNSGGKKYDTILNYAQTLFDNSHQEQWYLDVDYFNDTLELERDSSSGTAKAKKLTIGSNDVEVIDQKIASQLGYCIDPVTKKFKIHYSNGKVQPYVEGGSAGIKFNLNDGTFAVDISMDDNLSDTADKCLLDNFDSNGQTLTRIKKMNAHESGYGNFDCWNNRMETVIEKIDLAKKFKYTVDSSHTLGLYTCINFTDGTSRDFVGGVAASPTEGNIKQCRTAIANAVNDFIATLPYVNSTYNLDSTWDSFQHSYNEIVADGKILSHGSNWRGNFTYEDVGLYYLYEGSRKYLGGDSDSLIQIHCKAVKDIGDSTGSSSFWLNDWSSNEPKNVSDVRYFGFKNGEINLSFDGAGSSASYSLILYNRMSEIYTRNCQGHNFTYCGGHVGIHSHGTVYSATNEQIAVAGTQEETVTPIATNFSLADEGYSSIKGKLDPSKFDTDTLVAYVKSGNANAPWIDAQGSYFGMRGVNLYVVGETWEKGINTDQLNTKNAKMFAKDIFDIDTGVLYGCNIFPLHGDYANYQGWTADNISFVVGRITSDWNDIYGFNIPLEIGENIVQNVSNSKHLFNLPLSTSDISKINDALKTAYGSDYSTEREEAVKRALMWVGRGHAECYMGETLLTAVVDSDGKITGYKEIDPGHSDHGFLISSETGSTRKSNGTQLDTDRGIGANTFKELISGLNITENCTSGNEYTFINYLRAETGATVNNISQDLGYAAQTDPTSRSYTGTNALPGDYLVTTRSYSIRNNLDVDLSSGFDIETLNYYSTGKVHEAVFIGIVSEDIELSSNQKIHAGVPIIIDMTTLGQYSYYSRKDGEVKSFKNGARNIGGIYLHASSTEDYWHRKNKTIYYWLSDKGITDCGTKVLPYNYSG